MELHQPQKFSPVHAPNVERCRRPGPAKAPAATFDGKPEFRSPHDARLLPSVLQARRFCLNPLTKRIRALFSAALCR
jgi:hypothetical protein